MTRGKPVIAGGVVVVTLMAVAGSIWLAGNARPDEIAAGEQVYVDHCAFCHGVNLEGQPNWRSPLPSGRLPAPPHDDTGHTWHHSDKDLFAIVKGGLGAIVPGYESDMPAFGGVLTDEEIGAVIAFIKSTWPRREREYQEQRTRASGA